MKDPKLRKVTFPHTQVKWNPIYSPKTPSEVYWLTRSGYLSLSNRIARGTKPLSLYDSSPVGDYKAKTNHDTLLCGIEWKSSHPHPAQKRKAPNKWKGREAKRSSENKNLESIWNFGEEHNTIDTDIPSLCNLVQTMLIQKIVLNSEN